MAPRRTKKTTVSQDKLADAEREEVRRVASEDFQAAWHTGTDVRASKARDYEVYRGYRRDASGGIGNKDRRGPLNWSSLNIPLAFWVVETEAPRLGTQPPSVTVTPTNARSAPYARAKQLRMNHLLRKGNYERELITAIKSMLILGKGPTKTTYCPDVGGPKMVAIDYFDYFLSPHASSYRDAEFIAHRTWWTPRMIRGLAQLHDAAGNPLYDHECLERLVNEAGDRSMHDDTWADRRQAAGAGLIHSPAADKGVVPIIEVWYRDGWVITIGGTQGDHLLRIQGPDDIGRMRHYKVGEGRGYGKPLMPFVEFENSPDLFMPDPISSVEMVADHQTEASLIRNLTIDQMIQNVMSPLIYDRGQGIAKKDVDAAFGQPGGALGVEGDPSRAVYRMQPGVMPQDPYAIIENIRSEAQQTTGVSDWAAGQTSAAGVQNQTATAVSIITGEGNKRFQFKTKLVQLAAGEIARLYDCIDRQFCPEKVFIPMKADMKVPDNAQGVQQIDGGFAEIDYTVNLPENEYDIIVDAGSLVDPARSEQAQDLMNIIGLASQSPEIAMRVDFDTLISEFFQVSGFNPDRFIKSPEQVQQEQMQQMLAQMGAQAGAAPQEGAPPTDQPQADPTAEQALV